MVLLMSFLGAISFYVFFIIYDFLFYDFSIFLGNFDEK